MIRQFSELLECGHVLYQDYSDRKVTCQSFRIIPGFSAETRFSIRLRNGSSVMDGSRVACRAFPINYLFSFIC